MLTAHQLHFSYPDEKSFAYHFSLEAGQKYWLKGPSGSGKSTLLRLLSGLLQANGGEIQLEAEPLSGSNSFSLRQKLVYLPQKLNPGPLKVQELFDQIFGLKANQHLRPSEEELRQYFQKFKLEASYLQSDFNDLSGGEQQRVALIMALLLQRKIMLLDESLSAIDPELRKLVLEELAKTKALVILVAHDEPRHEAFRPIHINDLKIN